MRICNACRSLIGCKICPYCESANTDIVKGTVPPKLDRKQKRVITLKREA